jgi:hypothetical protein
MCDAGLIVAQATDALDTALDAGLALPRSIASAVAASTSGQPSVRSSTR